MCTRAQDTSSSRRTEIYSAINTLLGQYFFKHNYKPSANARPENPFHGSTDCAFSRAKKCLRNYCYRSMAISISLPKQLQRGKGIEIEFEISVIIMPVKRWSWCDARL